MAQAQHIDEAIAHLRERAARHPPDRFPVQHATALFHLGGALTNAGQLEEAEAALAQAAALFDPARLRLEHAKALNGLGVVLRLSQRPHDAARAFERAAVAFAASEAKLEQGAALYNLGLVRREAGDDEDAAEAFTRAREIFEAGRSAAQAGAAARELGATLLASGDLEAGRPALEHAVGLSTQAGDRAGAGAAANLLGLVELAAGRAPAAVTALSGALADHPRSLRPAEYAMVKANLALAHEQAGDTLRARLAARQARGVPAAPMPVRAQAEQVEGRLGPGAGQIMALLDLEPADRWPALVREEVARWVDAGPGEREGEAEAWIGGQLDREGEGADRAEALLGALLELPPAALDAVASALVRALGRLDADARDDFRAETSMAMARFHVPQLERLRETLNRLADELGEEAAWR